MFSFLECIVQVGFIPTKTAVETVFVGIGAKQLLLSLAAGLFHLLTFNCVRLAIAENEDLPVADDFMYVLLCS